MNKNKVSQFIAGVERLVKPLDVAAISFFNSFTSHFPITLQKKFMANTAKTIPHMGFVVEPYSFFLCYPITHLEAARKLLPNEYKLIKTKIFTDDTPQYYVIFGCFTAHTSAFWGSRIEMYVIAENTNTGMLSWVIVDYDTNTNSYDPARGLITATSTDSVMTTSYDGTLLVDMKRNDGSRRLAAHANVTAGTMTALDQRLWLEGNLSVDYGQHLRDATTAPFSLRFDAGEVTQALRLPLAKTIIEENNWHTGLYTAKPTQVVCFPYAQHFITDSYPQGDYIANEAALSKAIKEFGDLNEIKTFSALPIQRQIFTGWFISTIISTSVLIFLIVHFILAH